MESSWEELPSYGIEGRYRYEVSIDYSNMKSFVLLPVDDNAFSTPESTAHYRKEIVRALKTKGLSENSENPDFEIRTHPIGTYREEYVTMYGSIAFSKAWLRVTFVPDNSPV